jgi:transcriptional regulator with XRE-family HTH domain
MHDLQIGRAARALRHRLALRQVDVADRVGLGHDVISRLERGRIEGLTVRTLRKLSPPSTRRSCSSFAGAAANWSEFSIGGTRI